MVCLGQFGLGIVTSGFCTLRLLKLGLFILGFLRVGLRTFSLTLGFLLFWEVLTFGVSSSVHFLIWWDFERSSQHHFLKNFLNFQFLSDFFQNRRHQFFLLWEDVVDGGNHGYVRRKRTEANLFQQVSRKCLNFFLVLVNFWGSDPSSKVAIVENSRIHILPKNDLWQFIFLPHHCFVHPLKQGHSVYRPCIKSNTRFGCPNQANCSCFLGAGGLDL